MFFIIAVTQGQKEIPYNFNFFCSNCNQNTTATLFVTYSVLSLFFIPIFKWNKRYYIKTTCCGSIYELSSDIGKLIESGNNVQITSKDVFLVQKSSGYKRRYCSNCGFPIDSDFDFCPKCGQKL